VLGNAIGNGLQAAIFWIWWKKRTPAPKEPIPLAMIRESLAWRRTSVMGLAWLCNFAFNTIDMLMLGIMSNTQQVGLYSAAYRVVNQVLCTYYLVTIVLYPQLARQDRDQRVRMLRPGILFSLLGAGAAMAAVLTVSRRPVLTILFGHQFLMAAPLLLLLAWAIPFDFLTSYLGNAYIAWGMEKKILLCTVVAAGSNIVLNLIWIPSYGATAAAVNTLISYGIFLAGLALAGRFAKELAGVPQVQTELIAQDF
jgi:O-antigen/teichoic acid export membrane protein